MALTKATLIDLNSNELVLDLDADTSITADTDDTIHIKIAGSDELTLTSTAIAPSTSDGQALGTSSLMFSDLFLASGSVINFNNGDVTLTHASNLLTLDGGSLDLDGEALILDADGDTKLVESSDDVIHFQFAGSTSTPTEFGAGYINLKNQGTQSYMRFYCESSNAHYTQLQAAAHSDYSGNATVTLPVATSTLATTALSETLTNKTLTSPDINTSIELLARAEARFQDASGGQFVALEAPATVSSSFVLTLPAADGSSGQFLKTDGSGALSFDTVSSAADDLTAGDAAVNLTTTSGNITIDAQGDDTDIILKGTDGGSDTTFLTIDGSAAGEATFNAGIVIADAGNIGSASDKDAIAIASNGVTTFSQNPVFPAGGVDIASLDIDGGTDIGAAIADADLFIIDDGAGGTNRKVAASRIKTYAGFSVADITGATALGAEPADTDELIISDAGTLKRVDYSYIKPDTYIHYQNVRTSAVSAGDAYMQLTSLFDSTYKIYKFFLYNINMGSDSKIRLQLLTSTNTVEGDSGDYKYAGNGKNSDAQGSDWSSNDATFIELTGETLRQDAGMVGGIEVTVYDPADTNLRTRVVMQGGATRTGNYTYSAFGTAETTFTTAVTGIKVLAETGTFDSLSIKVFGIV